MAAPEEHARWSPSKSAINIHCTAALKACEGIEEEPSEYAAAGTAGHALGEWKGRHLLGLPVGRRPVSDYNTDELEENTDDYADFVYGVYAEAKKTCKDPVAFFEKRVSIDDLVPGCFGTTDFGCVADGVLHIVDLKTGFIEVRCENNSQMMIYALGCLREFDFLYDITSVRMTIFQPRIHNCDTWEISVEDLNRWAEEVLKPAAAESLSGNGTFQPGPWCSNYFCAARNRCRARADQFLELAKLDFKLPALLSDEEIAIALDKADQISQWCSEVMAYTTALAVNEGRQFAGWKLVRGQSRRKFTDTAAVEKAAKKAGYQDIYDTSLKSLATLEKLMGKSKFQEVLGAYVVKPEGKLTLARDNDRRSEVHNSVEKDFQIEGGISE